MDNQHSLNNQNNIQDKYFMNMKTAYFPSENISNQVLTDYLNKQYNNNENATAINNNKQNNNMNIYEDDDFIDIDEYDDLNDITDDEINNIFNKFNNKKESDNDLERKNYSAPPNNFNSILERNPNENIITKENEPPDVQHIINNNQKYNASNKKYILKPGSNLTSSNNTNLTKTTNNTNNTNIINQNQAIANNNQSNLNKEYQAYHAYPINNFNNNNTHIQNNNNNNNKHNMKLVNDINTFHRPENNRQPIKIKEEKEFTEIDPYFGLELKNISKSTNLSSKVEAEFYGLTKFLDKIYSLDKTISRFSENKQEVEMINTVAKQNILLLQFMEQFNNLNNVLSDEQNILDKELNQLSNNLNEQEILNKAQSLSPIRNNHTKSDSNLQNLTNISNLNSKLLTSQIKPEPLSIKLDKEKVLNKPLNNLIRENQVLEKKLNKYQDPQFLINIDLEIKELNLQIDFLTSENKKLKKEYMRIEKDNKNNPNGKILQELQKRNAECDSYKKQNEILKEKITVSQNRLVKLEKELKAKIEQYKNNQDFINQLNDNQIIFNNNKHSNNKVLSSTTKYSKSRNDTLPDIHEKRKSVNVTHNNNYLITNNSNNPKKPDKLINNRGYSASNNPNSIQFQKVKDINKSNKLDTNTNSKVSSYSNNNFNKPSNNNIRSTTSNNNIRNQPHYLTSTVATNKKSTNNYNYLYNNTSSNKVNRISNNNKTKQIRNINSINNANSNFSQNSHLLISNLTNKNENKSKSPMIKDLNQINDVNIEALKQKLIRLEAIYNGNDEKFKKDITASEKNIAILEKEKEQLVNKFLSRKAYLSYLKKEGRKLGAKNIDTTYTKTQEYYELLGDVMINRENDFYYLTNLKIEKNDDYGDFDNNLDDEQQENNAVTSNNIEYSHYNNIPAANSINNVALNNKIDYLNKKEPNDLFPDIKDNNYSDNNNLNKSDNILLEEKENELQTPSNNLFHLKTYNTNNTEVNKIANNNANNSGNNIITQNNKSNKENVINKLSLLNENNNKNLKENKENNEKLNTATKKTDELKSVDINKKLVFEGTNSKSEVTNKENKSNKYENNDTHHIDHIDNINKNQIKESNNKINDDKLSDLGSINFDVLNESKCSDIKFKTNTNKNNLEPIIKNNKDYDTPKKKDNKEDNNLVSSILQKEINTAHKSNTIKEFTDKLKSKTSIKYDSKSYTVNKDKEDTINPNNPLNQDSRFDSINIKQKLKNKRYLNESDTELMRQMTEDKKTNNNSITQKKVYHKDSAKATYIYNATEDKNNDNDIGSVNKSIKQLLNKSSFNKEVIKEESQKNNNNAASLNINNSNNEDKVHNDKDKEANFHSQVDLSSTNKFTGTSKVGISDEKNKDKNVLLNSNQNNINIINHSKVNSQNTNNLIESKKQTDLEDTMMNFYRNYNDKKIDVIDNNDESYNAAVNNDKSNNILNMQNAGNENQVHNLVSESKNSQNKDNDIMNHTVYNNNDKPMSSMNIEDNDNDNNNKGIVDTQNKIDIDFNNLEINDTPTLAHNNQEDKIIEELKKDDLQNIKANKIPSINFDNLEEDIKPENSQNNKEAKKPIKIPSINFDNIEPKESSKINHTSKNEEEEYEEEDEEEEYEYDDVDKAESEVNILNNNNKTNQANIANNASNANKRTSNISEEIDFNLLNSADERNNTEAKNNLSKIASKLSTSQNIKEINKQVSKLSRYSKESAKKIDIHKKVSSDNDANVNIYPNNLSEAIITKPVVGNKNDDSFQLIEEIHNTANNNVIAYNNKTVIKDIATKHNNRLQVNNLDDLDEIDFDN